MHQRRRLEEDTIRGQDRKLGLGQTSRKGDSAHSPIEISQCADLEKSKSKHNGLSWSDNKFQIMLPQVGRPEVARLANVNVETTLHEASLERHGDSTIPKRAESRDSHQKDSEAR